MAPMRNINVELGEWNEDAEDLVDGVVGDAVEFDGQPVDV
jgi:hypothetical protein